MSNRGFGIAAHGRPQHPKTRAKEPARFLVLIVDATGVAAARLFDAARRPVADFDASAEEVAVMTQGLTPELGAAGSDWDVALRGHSAEERRAAEVYTLDV